MKRTLLALMCVGLFGPVIAVASHLTPAGAQKLARQGQRVAFRLSGQ